MSLQVRYQTLQMSADFDVNGIEDTVSIGDIFLTHVPDGSYAIRALGRCGEALPGRDISVTLYHWAWKNGQVFELTTDPTGTCVLGLLEGIRNVEACALLSVLPALVSADSFQCCLFQN